MLSVFNSLPSCRIGREVVDSTELHGEPFEFELGQRPSDAIGCWEGALSLPLPHRRALV